MTWLVDSLHHYGEALVFAIVLLEQAGLPVPSALVLVAAGALVGQGLLNGWLILALGMLASVGANYAWYRAGWWQGQRVLGLLCRISLDPDQCVRLSESLFGKVGSASLLIAHFLPGVSTLAPPLAGVLRVPRLRFLVLETLGSALWLVVTVGLGWLFSDRLDWVGQQLASWGLTAGVGLLLALLGWIAFKLLRRAWIIRRLRSDRITAEELHGKLQAREPLLVLDLRHPLQQERLPHAIPGALRIAPTELWKRHIEIPRDRDVVLYCS